MDELSLARGKSARHSPPTPLETAAPTTAEYEARIESLERELAKTRAQLMQTEQRFFLAEDNARIGVWDYDVRTGKTYLSPGWSSMLGMQHDTAPSEWVDWVKVVHPDDVERVEHAYQRILRDPRAPYEQEFRMRHASGRYCWVLSRAKALSDDKGRVTRLVGVHIDVTALKEIHDQMKERERSFEELSLIMPHMFSIADRTGRMVFVSHAWTQYSGMSLAETTANDAWMSLVHPEDRPAVIENWTKIMQGLDTTTIECRFQRNSDGMYRWHTCNSFPMRRKDGVVERWYLSAQDIHEYKCTVAELSVASRRYQSLFDSNVLGIVICDREVIREANDNFLRLVGYSREDLTAGKLRYRGMTPGEYQHLDVLRSEAYKRSRVIPPFEKEYIRKDGTRVPVLVSCVVLEKDPYTVFGIVIDLSERKRVENELRNIATQLRSTNEDLEHFAYVASHDLSEPTKTLSLYLELLSQKAAYDSSDERSDILECASEACERLTHQVKILTEYTGAKKLTFEPSHFEARSALDEALKKLDAEIRELEARIKIAFLPKVWADRSMLVESFETILSNALERSDSGTVPEITVQCVEALGNWVFSITDNSRPQTPEAETTDKAINNIGLSLCRKMIDRHGGQLWVDSNPDKGNTVSFTLPKTALSPKRAPTPKFSVGLQ